MKKTPTKTKATKIPIYKIAMEIKSLEATLNISGDYHYGARGIEASEIVKALTRTKKDLFRIFTGDLIENALKTSVGHNYDVAIPDPSDQLKDMKEVLKKIMKFQMGTKQWEKYKCPGKTCHNDAVAVGVGGNHEYRTRKLTGQWIDKEMYEEAKILPMGQGGIVELTIWNKKLNMSRTYNIYVSHAPGKTNATSIESILRAFKKKQSVLPGIDVICFGHYHKRFIQSDGYFDMATDTFRKVMYVINPSPLIGAEYALEAGYPPCQEGYSTDIYLPLDPDKQPYGII